MDTNKKLREAVIAKMQSGDFEIKPCPFCGGQPEIEDEETFVKLDTNHNGACIDIQCPRCNVQMYDHTHDEHDYYVRAFLVTEKWNRRVK